MIDENLDCYGIKSRQDARDLVRRARAHSILGEDDVLAVAQDEVQAVACWAVTRPAAIIDTCERLSGSAVFWP